MRNTFRTPFALRLLLLLVLSGLTPRAVGTPPPAGVVPLGSPAGGFGIDGDLFANQPATNLGDWLQPTNAAPPGTGGAVLDSAGVPLNAATTFHLIDPYKGVGNDLIFVGGLKWNDNPNTWGWTEGNSSAKTDINNVLLHMTTDADGHNWVVIAADRLSTSGDSYIDFELLQNTLTRSNNGTFVSSGPHGGRTVHDLVLSLAFGGGGKVVDFFVWQWQTNGSGGYAYVDATASLPAGRVFAALNSNSIVVPYGAFGSTNYQPNAFGEAALDLTALIGNFDPCMSFGVRTIMVKTKTSTSDTSGIEDFVDPIQYTLQVGPSANAGPDQFRCTEGASTAFPLPGVVTAGLVPIISTNWSIVAGTATIDSTNSANTIAHVSSATATLRLTVVQANGCTESDDIVLTVKPLPSCAISGPSSVCPGSNPQFTGPPGMNAYSWSITGNGIIAGPTNQPTVTVTAGNACAETFTLSLNVTSNGCASACSTGVLVNDTTPPTLTCPPDRVLECPADTRTNVTGVATAQDDCGKVTVTFSDAVSDGCLGTRTILRTWTATDTCGNSVSCVQTITVRDTTKPTITCPPNRILECPANTGTNATGVATASDTCSTVAIDYTDLVSTNCGGSTVIARTWTATDDCGNSASCVQTITVRDTTPPVIMCPPNLTLDCPADTGTNATGVATATDGCSEVTISFTDAVSTNCGGTSVIARTWTATDACSNKASCVQTITVRDTTPPVITCPPDLTLDCPADTRTNATGVASATDGCSTVNISFSDLVTTNCGGTRLIARTWRATDACSNSASCVQTIIVRDITPPTLICPPDRLLECPADTRTNVTGVATATDDCSQVTIGFSDLVTTNCGNTKVIARTWTATDACSNKSSCVQTIIVRDTTPPVITCPPDRLLECPADTRTNVTGVATATDGCNQVTISFNDAVTTNCAGTKVIARTWTATDACSNNASCVQTIVVRDTTPPAITCPPNLTLDCPADTRTNATGVATATDGCGQVAINFSDAVSTNCGGTEVIARTWTATDECNNSASCLQTITVRDLTPPNLICPPNLVLECPADTDTNATGVATATDGCSQVTIAYADVVTTNCGGTKVIARTWTATDQCANRSSCVQTITVRDTTPPVITCPPDFTLDCPADTRTNATGVATATDGCSQVTINSSDLVTTNCGGTKVIARTWRATDACSNSVSCLQTIVVRDIAPPSLTCPPDLVLECPADTRTNATGMATATDDCSQVTIGFSDLVTTNCGGTKVIARTWTATDACNNSASCVQTITVRDTTPPVITCPPDRVLECPADTRTNATGVATATDDCSQVTIGFNDLVTTNCGNTKVIARTSTATDACNNSASCLQTITVRDTIPPTITCPPDRVLECPADTSTNATGVASASDGCSQVAISFSDLVTTNCAGTKVIERTWTATDACNNRASCVQTITVRDTTPPTITCPPDRTLECPANTSTNATGVATATDGCSQVTINFGDLVTTNCGGTKVIARTWTATDACNNSASCVQTIIVRDTTPPTITCPPNLTLECPAVTSTNATGVATATDGCSQVTISFRDLVTTNCGSTRVIARTWTATDECNNSASCLQTIIVRDTVKPTLTCPPNVVLECPALDTGTNVTGTATASDGCGAVTLTYSDSVTTNCGATKVIARTWTASDACGNSSSCVQTITVRDTTPPTITCPPNLTLECPAVTTTNATGVATAQDGCGAVTITFSDVVSNACSSTRTISRTWRATDACGNSASCVQTITVRDTLQPILTVPSDLTLECGASTAPSATGTATAQDGCSATTVSFSDIVSNACGGTKMISRRWTAVDTCGNSTNAVQTITVRDTTPPALTLPPNRVLQCPGDTRTNVTGVATATDGCGTVSISYSDVVSNSCGLTRTVLRLWTATDQCGNSTNGLQTIAVVDTTKPGITCPNISVQCVGDLPAAHTSLAAFLAAGGTASDTCSAALTFALMSDSGLVGRCPGTVTRVYRVTDDCGNFGEVTQRITVDDTIPPVLTCATNVTVECGVSLDPANTGRATATDNCSTNVSITYGDVPVPSSYNINFYAADPGENSAPYLPTYLKVAPASLPCPDAARLTGRAQDPLRNAVAYGPTYSQLDALTSLGGETMTLGQIVPFEAVIGLSGSPGPERGTVEFTASWATHTTSNDKFGFDTNYMVYCAFVDAYDPGAIDPDNNARVESVRSVLVNPGTIDEQIVGTFRVSGLDVGDQVVVEIWLVLNSTMPQHVGGTIAAQMVSAQKALTPPEPISIGSKTISIGNLNKIVPLPPPQAQPPLGPPPNPPPQPPTLPGRTLNLLDRTWTATDDCGNRNTCVQRITVRDTTPPALAVPADVVLECPATDISTNVTGVAVAQDACGSTLLSYSDIVSNDCGGTKVVSRTWTATDDSGLSTNVVQTITVRDTTPPVITCPPDRTLECPADTRTNVTGVATATDGCSQVTISFSDLVTTNCGGTKVIARTWTATDACNNSVSCVQTITVRDTTPPTITCPPDRTLECPADTSTNATGVATALDGCGSVIVTFSDSVTTNCGSTRVIARTWTATDACNNTASCLQTITVRDTVKPTITCPPNVVLECPAADTGTNVTGAATASDGCGAVTVTYSDSVTTNCGATKVIARTWTASDACGNSSSCVQTITVRDTTPPTITCPPNLTLECPAVTTTNATGVATAQDGCGAVTITFSDLVTTNCGGTKTISRTWRATDACNNSASCVQTLTVRDTIKPTITCPPDVTLECGASTAPSATGTATAQDGCSAATVSYTDAVSTLCGGSKVITRTWTATDGCGYSASCVQAINVRDTTPPAIVCPPDRTVDTGQNWSFDAPTATDTCGGVTVRVLGTVTNATGSNTFVVTRTWEAADQCGNTATCAQKITVVPAPTLELMRTGPSSLMLRWPEWAAGYYVELSGSLPSTNWSPMPMTSFLSNGFNCFEFTPGSNLNFYRLRKPMP